MVDVVDLTYTQLLWCNTWYVREETLTGATADLVNYQYRGNTPFLWSVEVSQAAADMGVW